MEGGAGEKEKENIDKATHKGKDIKQTEGGDQTVSGFGYKSSIFSLLSNPIKRPNLTLI